MASSAAAAVASAPESSGERPFFPDEPKGPIVKTEIPGPKSMAAIKRLTKVFDTRSLNMMADYTQSFGN
jgi:4-aminobutyrate aminotransferase/(S)-3-amino-2-methylpropionate transaminase